MQYTLEHVITIMDVLQFKDKSMTFNTTSIVNSYLVMKSFGLRPNNVVHIRSANSKGPIKALQELNIKTSNKKSLRTSSTKEQHFLFPPKHDI